MLVHVLACDYDGTIAEFGRIADGTRRALGRVRESGRKLVLVTGRMLPDLRSVCPDADTLFDAVVAENGAVVYLPQTRQVRTLGPAPEPALLGALRRGGVPFVPGDSIVATDAQLAEPALAAIREAGVERTLVFNRRSLMLLPGGVTKGTGLAALLAAMELSPHNAVGVGDAENDHAFLGLCECAVAVADAIPALRARADYVTTAPNGAGVAAFIDEHVLADAAGLIPRLGRHQLALGDRDGRPVTIPAHGTNLLIVGPSGSGKSTIAAVLAEHLVEAGRAVCLLDPEGDYRTLAELPGVVVLGGKGEHSLPTSEELAQLLPRPATNVILDLSAMSRTEKVNYATTVLATAAAVRTITGMPHWLIVDEAHHIAPAGGSSADEWLRPGSESTCLITLAAADVSPEVRRLVNAVASTETAAFEDALRTLRGGIAGAPPRGAAALARREALLADLRGPAPHAVRFRVGRRRIGSRRHIRHIRKYAEGELPPERSFYFRGPSGQLNLRAANLTRFCELAEGVDEATWAHHLRRGEYSVWVARVIKDSDLAAEIAVLERDDGVSPAEARRRICEAVQRRYTV